MAWCQICYKVYDDPNIIPLSICPICAKKDREITQSDRTKLEEKTKIFLTQIEDAHKNAEDSKLIFGIYGKGK